MMEGSVNHMESVMQEKKNLMQDMPIDNRGVGEMSPYKMDHGSAAHHAGKSELHKDPNKDMPGDGHKHKGGKNPTQEEGKQLMDTSGAVGKMSPYKFTGMSGGSAMHNEDPELKKRQIIEDIRLRQQENIEKKDIHRNALEKKKQELRKEKKEYKVVKPRVGNVN